MASCGGLLIRLSMCRHAPRPGPKGAPPRPQVANLPYKAICFLMFWALLLAQTPPKTTLDGVYTKAQATRGQAGYATYCASCHGADLGSFSGPPLKGNLFLDRWREFNLDVLLSLIVTTMPASNVGSLSENAYIDIFSYLLESNGSPAGSKDLTAAVAATTLLVGKDGPQPLPSSAQVALVGCMTEDSGNGFFLTMATEPARTLNPWEISADEMREAKAQLLGPLVFRLQNVSDLPDFKPDVLLGNKMEAKGILVRQPNNMRVNVLALKMVAQGCE